MSAFDSIPSATITADLGQGVVEQSATSWSIDRTLSGGGLPGQARAASGSSVGSGTVSVESDATPWNTGAIRPAGRVTVSASEDVGVAASRVGTMVVRSVGAPSALSSERHLSIEDDLGGMRGSVTIPASLWTPDTWRNPAYGMDAAWAIDEAARNSGLYQTPPIAASAIFAAHLTGAPRYEVGSFWNYAETNFTWGTVDGSTMLTHFAGAWGEATAPLPVGESIYLIANFPSGLTVRFRASHDDSSGFAFTVRANDVASWPDGGSSTNQRFIPGVDDPNNALRRQVELRLTGVSGRTATGMQVRARRSIAAGWSEWSVASFSSPVTFSEQNVRISLSHPLPSKAFNGVQLHLEDDPVVWTPRTAKVAASGSRMQALLTPRTASSWSLIQEVAAAALGAVWIDEDGVLNYRNREQLRGSGTPAETVYSLDSLDDVPWEVSTDDVADRVEVTYNPPAITQVSDYSATVWESTEVVTIGAGSTAVIEQDIDGAADDLAPWYPAWNTTVAPATRYSRWAASTLPGGGGPQPADNALDITTEMVNPSRVRIRIRNTTTGTLYTAGTDGTTLLTLRANVVARPSEPLTLSTGLPADKAIAPLSINCGSWVQDQDTAQEILSWLTGTLSQPLPILRQVGVTPKASRRLGDVIVIRDPYTELASKALITGIHSSGEAGRYSQSLDLAILAPLESDVARRWTAIPLATEADIATYITAQLGASATEADVARWLSTEVLA